jgi:hypothetical protein
LDQWRPLNPEVGGLAGPPPSALTSTTALDMFESGGRPRDLTQQQISLLREHLNTNFWDFAYLIGGVDILYAPIHQGVCELQERFGTPGWKRLMIQLPRGALKSTLGTRTGALWRICRDPNTTVAIFNEKVERVEKWLLAIQSIVAGNELFHALYRDWIPQGIAKDDPRPKAKSLKWSSREMTFERDRMGVPEASITAMSVGGASAGGHWEWLYHDDLISVEAQQSQVVMKAAKDWFDTSIYLGPSPEMMNAWISCTRWHYDDVYEHARKYHNFQLYRRAAIEEGASVWPERWSLEYLLKEQVTRPSAFASQMMNTPSPGEHAQFKTEWVKQFSLATDETGKDVLIIRREDYNPSQSIIDEDAPQVVRLDQCNAILLVDPAPSTETDRRSQPTARTAMVLKLIDPWGRRFWLDLWAGREGPIEEIRRILAMLTKWGRTRYGIEEVVFSKLYAPFLKYVAQRESTFTPRYTPLKPGKREKDYRIGGLIRSFSEGWEYLHTPLVSQVLEEAIPYPYGATVDILDAASYDRDQGVLTRLESDDEEWWREERTMGGVSGARDCTGYGDA